MFKPAKYTFFGKPIVEFTPEQEERPEEIDNEIAQVAVKTRKPKPPKYLPGERLLQRINETQKNKKLKTKRQSYRNNNITRKEIIQNSIETVMKELSI